jgi:hypothetical protein
LTDGVLAPERWPSSAREEDSRNASVDAPVDRAHEVKDAFTAARTALLDDRLRRASA